MNDIDILEQQAIDAAINSQWHDAIKLNEKILKQDNKNLAAYLRLGFIYLQTNKIAEAKKFYQRALRLQPKNQVAVENLERIGILEEEKGSKKLSAQTNLDPSLFLEVPGKTKSVALVNLGQKKDLAGLSIGQIVELKAKKRKVETRTTSGQYIGCLPDDLSKRLIFFLKAKSKYNAYVKEAGVNRVVLFIKEEAKGKKVAQFLSFPQNSQTNIDQISEDVKNEDEEVASEEEEWDVLSTELSHEEKEEIIGIHHEEDDVEE